MQELNLHTICLISLRLAVPSWDATVSLKLKLKHIYYLLLTLSLIYRGKDIFTDAKLFPEQ